MKVAKKLIRRCWDPQGTLDADLWAQGILQHRNTPGPDGRSPTEVLYGRPVRDLLPAHLRDLSAEWQVAADRADASAAARQEQIEERYNSRAADLLELQVGTAVAVQNQDSKRCDRYGVVGQNRRYFL